MMLGGAFVKEVKEYCCNGECNLQKILINFACSRNVPQINSKFISEEEIKWTFQNRWKNQQRLLCRETHDLSINIFFLPKGRQWNFVGNKCQPLGAEDEVSAQW